MQQVIRRFFFPISQMTTIFVEVKAAYAKDMVTGFVRLNGTTVGVVANRSEVYGEDGEVTENFGTVLSGKGAQKAADFVKFCDAFEIPVLSLDKCDRLQGMQVF